MSDTSGHSHPGLGEPTDVTAADAGRDGADAPPPATLDPGNRRDDDLGAGDGVDVQPGGEG